MLINDHDDNGDGDHDGDDVDDDDVDSELGRVISEVPTIIYMMM